MKTRKQDSSPPVVLAADYSPADQNLTKRVLGRAGPDCDLRLASDGEEALDYLFRRGLCTDPASCPRPELLLLDINMPRVTGIGVLDAVKRDVDQRAYWFELVRLP